MPRINSALAHDACVPRAIFPFRASYELDAEPSTITVHGNHIVVTCREAAVEVPLAERRVVLLKMRAGLLLFRRAMSQAA